jgi:hypothetical protein
MISKKYKINFFIFSVLFFYLLFLIKINIIFAYNKIIYNFNYPIDPYSLKSKFDIDSFNKKKINIEGFQYAYGTNILKVYQPYISSGLDKAEFINLYKRNFFLKKNLIVQDELSKEFKFTFQVKNLNLNFLILYFIKTFLIIFIFFIFFKWIFYFSNKLK